MIAKKQTQEVNGYYDLYVEETIQDINGNDVVIPKLIGTYSLEQLNQERTSYQNQINLIDEKINTINAIITD